MVKLGTKVKDSITGFEGIATSRTEFLHGCVRVGVQPTELKDGKPIEAQYFDEQQLVQDSRPVESNATRGGPAPCPPPRAVPQR